MSTPRTVREIMTQDVIYLREEEDLSAIEEGMERLGLRHLPVVDGDKLVGLVSHRDVLRYTLGTLAENRLSRQLDERRKRSSFVADVMTRDVKTVRPETLLADAARVLLKHRFGCLPVTKDDGTLVGIVTEHDFLQLTAQLLDAAGADTGA